MCVCVCVCVRACCIHTVVGSLRRCAVSERGAPLPIIANVRSFRFHPTVTVSCSLQTKGILGFVSFLGKDFFFYLIQSASSGYEAHAASASGCSGGSCLAGEALEHVSSAKVKNEWSDISSLLMLAWQM